jgi:hypothetical protein
MLYSPLEVKIIIYPHLKGALNMFYIGNNV